MLMKIWDGHWLYSMFIHYLTETKAENLECEAPACKRILNKFFPKSLFAQFLCRCEGWADTYG